VQLNAGSSAWWLGVIVAGGSLSTSKVEIKDSGSVSAWTALSDYSYAYVFDKSIQLTLPISVRLTSSSGSQVTLTNVFTSWTATSLINTGKDYAASAGSSIIITPAAPSNPIAPVTAAPSVDNTSAPASGDTSSSTVTLTVYPSASEWWFAVVVGGVSADTIASVEVMDSGSLSTYALLTHNPWGYSLATQGAAFVAPLTVRVTNEAGLSVTATISSITPNAVATADGSL